MATADAMVDDILKPKKKGPGLIVQIAILLVLTGAAIGGGWFVGNMLGSSVKPAAAVEEPAPAPAADAHGGKKGGKEEVQAVSPHLFKLEPITTNLADPQEVWIRAEVALMFEGTPDPQTAELVHQDLLAYLRTVKSRQIESPSGFRHLRSDLDERAQLRSQGKVKSVLVRTLIFE